MDPLLAVFVIAAGGQVNDHQGRAWPNVVISTCNSFYAHNNAKILLQGQTLVPLLCVIAGTHKESLHTAYIPE